MVTPEPSTATEKRMTSATSSLTSATVARETRGIAALTYAKRFWFCVALAGQWLFTYYIFKAFGLPIAHQDLLAINKTSPITGYVPGDVFGNLFLLAHLLLAGVLSFGGLLQLVPQIRQRVPSLHRWNGRVFLSVALIAAFSGLYLTWVRGSRLSDLSALGITFNGFLIPIAAWFAWKHAIKGRFDAHRRWAIRTFLLISGVWTFRLMLMGWFMINQGPLGNSATLDGPMDQIFSFGCYLIPLAIAELCFRAEKRPDLRPIAAGVLAVASMMMAFGIFASYLMMWRPFIA